MNGLSMMKSHWGSGYFRAFCKDSQGCLPCEGITYLHLFLHIIIDQPLWMDEVVWWVQRDRVEGSPVQTALVHLPAPRFGEDQALDGGHKALKRGIDAVTHFLSHRSTTAVMLSDCYAVTLSPYVIMSCRAAATMSHCLSVTVNHFSFDEKMQVCNSVLLS